MTTYAAHIITESDRLGDPAIVVTTPADAGAADPIIDIPLDGEAGDLDELLAKHGLRPAGEPAHEPYTIVDVAVVDWPALIGRLTADRAAAQTEAERRDAAWRRVIADAMRTDGVPRNAVAQAAQVTEARAYQIRDGRR